MTSPLFIQARKEARALLPWTLGVAAGCVAVAAIAARNTGFPDFRYDQAVFFVIAYAFGVLAVAALCVGQELTHGTLPALLVQPVDRLRMLCLKLAVLAVALIGLGLLGGTLFPNAYIPRGQATRQLLIWGPVVAGIGLVPWLTLLTRKPMGGVVFAITIPGSILVISERFYSMRDGIEAFQITWYGTLLVSAIGLVAFVIQFRRLEAVGEGGHRPSAAAATITDVAIAGQLPTIRRNWVWLVLKKELRLQQMTLAVSGFYVLIAAGIMVAGSVDPVYGGPTFGALSLLHGYFVAMIAGSVASAEERHLGTLSGQILQPRNAWVQWVVKSGIVVALTLTLAILLPLALMAIHRPPDAFLVEDDYILGVSILSAAAMFVSSVSSNSLWSLLASFPAIGGAVLVGGTVMTTLRRFMFELFPTDWAKWNVLWKSDRATFDAAMNQYLAIRAIADALFVAAAIGAGVLVLYFAARNHRSLERNSWLIAKQAIVLLLYTAAASILYFGLPRYLSPLHG